MCKSISESNQQIQLLRKQFEQHKESIRLIQQQRDQLLVTTNDAPCLLPFLAPYFGAQFKIVHSLALIPSENERDLLAKIDVAEEYAAADQQDPVIQLSHSIHQDIKSLCHRSLSN